MEGRAAPIGDSRSLVVGGSGGIGRALSRALAGAGSHVVCHGARTERVDAVVSEIRGTGGTADAFPWPIDGVTPFTNELRSRFDSACFDIVVVSYGPVLYAPLGETSAQEWERLALHNVALPGALVSLLLPGMVERGRGRFVLLGGTDTGRIRSFGILPAYAAAKTAVSALCASAAETVRGSGVSVFLYLPGFVDTEYVTPAQRKRLVRLAPEGKLETPEEVARRLLDLIRRPSDQTNGRFFSS